MKVKVVDSGLPFRPAVKFPRLCEEVSLPPSRGLYVVYNGYWTLYVQGKDGYPRFKGSYPELLTAVFHANKGG